MTPPEAPAETTRQAAAWPGADGPEWHHGNNRYLSASLHWLRLRLERLVPERPRTSDPAARRAWFIRRRRREARPLALPAPRPRHDTNVQEALSRREAAASAIDPPPALLQLQRVFGLSDFERDTLLLAASPEFDPALPALCAEAQGMPAHGYPTFALALLAFEEPGWDAVSAQRPLRSARLIEVVPTATAALTACPLRAEERVVNFLKGLNQLDERLVTLTAPMPAGQASDLAPSQRDAAAIMIDRLRGAAARGHLPAVQCIGPDPGSRRLVAREATVALGRKLYQIDASALPRAAAEQEQLARLWRRESLLLPVALYIETEAAEDAAQVAAFLAREPGLVFVGLREPPQQGASLFSVEVDRPVATEQFQAWTQALDGDPGAARMLAGQFDLNLRDIADAVAATPHPDLDNVWETCRRRLRARLDQLAERLVPRLTWEDLVLPDEQTNLMHGIAGQARERYRVYEDWGFARRSARGLGISVLFSGESGTGKTLAAAVLASELKLDLYRIDLSAVVSKYIGETEKNLRRMFDAAEQGGAILFFDEADALFGKRSEVRDSHDRYANIEINYLLQRMEAFSGIAILATNMKSALDPAFLRRLRFIISFPFPGVNERKRIWERALPPETPREAVDYDRLARLNLSGGNIHSIALNAAFMAAGQKSEVTTAVLLAAARLELRKLDRAFAESDFR